jgi:sporulation protein YlmC with PRC-barrel domain
MLLLVLSPKGLNRIIKLFILQFYLEEPKMTVRLSKLFGMDIYTSDAEYKGKVFDLVVNLEKGRLETITTEPLKVRSKQEAKKIISEKSIAYKNVKAAKDIIIVGKGAAPELGEETIEEKAAPTQTGYSYRYRSRR